MSLNVPKPCKTAQSSLTSFNQNETSFLTSSEVQKSGVSQKEKPLCFQYVNPNLLLEWEGDAKSQNQITGSGIFRAYERSKDGNHKSKLVLSLQADKWKDGIPNGSVKIMQAFFYDNNRPDNVVKEVRKFVGNMKNMKKEGYGEYTFEFFYSNETKKVLQIKGNWIQDTIVEGSVNENGVIKENAKFLNNVEVNSNLSIFFNSKKSQNYLSPATRKCSRQKLKSIIPSNKCLVVQMSQENVLVKQNRQTSTKKNQQIGKQQLKINNNNLLFVPDKNVKSNMKNLR